MQKTKISSILAFIFLGIVVVSCQSAFNLRWTKKEAPAYFTARFETTKGQFEIESKREWSPLAVDRLYQLIKNDYYTNIAVYRVIPNYIAQFGIHNDSTITKAWSKVQIVDEPVLKSNTKGTVSFARGGPETRSTDLFINLKDNLPLDTISFMNVLGFPVIARVTSGFDVVASFYGEYGASLDDKQDSIVMYGNKYLKEKYPKLDYIKKASIIGKSRGN